MFTGLIQTVGHLESKRSLTQGERWEIQHDFEEPLVLGESIAVDGACLTVTAMHGHLFYAELSNETLERTHFSKVEVGQALNLERALKVGDRLGGHWVSGHVDAVCTIASLEQEGDFTKLVIEGVLPEHQLWLIEKGSVTVQGVSLTVNALDQTSFSLTLIPETLKATTLGHLKVGDSVNVEYDQLGKYSVKAYQVVCNREQFVTGWPPHPI